MPYREEKTIRETYTKTYNEIFGILSAIAMVMIVAGHLGYDLMSVGELFPYYSFHVPLFMFISGYFYREKEEEHPITYLKKKVQRLLVPYFIWNLIYGLIAWLLRLWGGMGMGETVSFRTLFLEPFISGYQFIYNYSAWFVPALFVIEIMNLAMRILLKKLRICYEWLILTGSLAVGICVVWLAIGGHVWGIYNMPGRILFLYPCFQMGQFYLKKLEKHDTLGSLPYFLIVMGVQMILKMFCGGLAYSSVWCAGFANGPVIPYVTAITGIAFWLRAARLLVPVLGADKRVTYLAKNTYAVMMHHVMVFMLIKMFLAGIAANTGCFADFDFDRFHYDIDYYYLVNGSEAFKMVYLILGITLPLMLQKGIDAIKARADIKGGRKSE